MRDRLSFTLFITSLGLAITGSYPFIWLLTRIYPRRFRGWIWRRTAQSIIRGVLRANGITVQGRHLGNVPPGIAVLFTSNHPSDWDGFVIFSLVDTNTAFFTAPFGQFTWILRCWLKQMEAIDVRRDAVDDARYPTANDKVIAVREAAESLLNGKSLILFPEGHIEILHSLHYFHSGAARISLLAHTPILPVAIVNADRIFPEKGVLMRGVITVAFGKPIDPPRLGLGEKLTKEHPEALRLHKKMHEAIVSMLPVRYLTDDYYQSKSKRIGVFIDIDNTLYHGLSQVDFILYLLKLHKIKWGQAIGIFKWLFLEKVHLVPHTTMMQGALMVLKGWDAGELSHYAHDFFRTEALPQVHYGLFPVLEDHVACGHTIIFVSEVIHPLANEFGKFFKASATLDTKMEETEGRYTGEVSTLSYGQKKADLIKRYATKAHIDLSKSFAYADSESDIPFLKLVGHPTVVNPHGYLKDWAQHEGVSIYDDSD